MFQFATKAKITLLLVSAMILAMTIAISSAMTLALTGKIDIIGQRDQISQDNSRDSKSQHLVDDALGKAYPVNVGLNAKEQKGIYASVFDDSSPPLKPGEVIWLTNELDEYCPTAKLVVDRVIPRDNKSVGSIFVSKEATVRLGLFKNNKPGIARLKLRKYTKSPDTNKPLKLPDINVSLIGK